MNTYVKGMVFLILWMELLSLVYHWHRLIKLSKTEGYPCWAPGGKWWHHDMVMLSSLLALCEGNPPVTGGFPSQRANNAELCCFLCFVSLKTVGQSVELPVIWYALMLKWSPHRVTLLWWRAWPGRAMTLRAWHLEGFTKELFGVVLECMSTG